jgi:hypothetical protein
MKQLILTFFAVILCYSLFFDEGRKSRTTVKEVSEKPDVAPSFIKTRQDTSDYFKFKSCYYTVNEQDWDREGFVSPNGVIAWR